MRFIQFPKSPRETTTSGVLPFDRRVDVTAIQRVWEALFQRHAMLRSAFIWKTVPEPVQVVGRDVKPQFVFKDWSNGEQDIQAAWQALLIMDREQGFDLSKPPLSRFYLAKAADDDWHFLWSPTTTRHSRRLSFRHPDARIPARIRERQALAIRSIFPLPRISRRSSTFYSRETTSKVGASGESGLQLLLRHRVSQ